MAKKLEELAKEHEILTQERELILVGIRNIQKRVQMLTEETVEFFASGYGKLAVLEAEFKEVQARIIDFNARNKNDELKIEVTTVQIETDDLICSLQENYLRLQISHGNKMSNVTSQPIISTNIPLPKINIPPFDGKIDEWSNFKGLYDSLVHTNDSLSNIEKFQYLKSYLFGDAASMVANYQLKGELYEIAYKTVNDRYHNKRRLAQLYIDQILDFNKNSNSRSLQGLLITHTTAVNSFKSLGLPDELDYILFHLTLRNLDSSTRKAFERQVSSQMIPTFDSLIKFADETCKTNELLVPIRSEPTQRKPKPLLLTHKKDPWPTRILQAPLPTCIVCQQQHPIYKCPVFNEMHYTKRRDLINSSRRCYRCLGAHFSKNCSSKGTCKVCGRQGHHSLLHKPSSSRSPVPTSSTARDVPSPVTPHTSNDVSALSCEAKRTGEHPVVLLGTAKALIADAVGHYHTVRAVLDSGSQTSAITFSLARKLGLSIHRSSFQVVGISSGVAHVHGTTQCIITSRYEANRQINVSPVVLDTIVNQLPIVKVPRLTIDIGSRPLADEEYFIPASVDLLIGADIYPFVVISSSPLVLPGKPVVIDTIFGGVLVGPVTSSVPLISNITLLSTCPPLDVALKQFWEIEEVSRIPVVNEDDALVEEHFRRTCTRDETGRYEVALPFKQTSQLSSLNNRNSAYRSYISLDHRLAKNDADRACYTSFLEEYLKLGHMVLAPTAVNYLLPHHPVFKTSGNGTKVRVVFNASSPSQQKCSLNDLMSSGPKLQKPLPGLLNNFRKFTVAMCADIRMMYRQIKVRPQDRKYQHIFWRPSESDSLLEFELTTVTYGLTSSPFLAQRVLSQLASDEGSNHPLASQVVHSSIYMDDILTGAPSVPLAKSLQAELVKLLKKGGFELRKWTSSHPDLVENLPAEWRETPISFNSEDSFYKILGLLWDPKGDNFSFHVSKFDTSLTKRNILAYIARIYDPLGFLAPVVFYLKWFLQQLWLLQLEWDDELPADLGANWMGFTSEAHHLSSLIVPRYLGIINEEASLIGFSDASTKGYAAVIYLVTKNQNSWRSSIVASKTKVAPLKSLTIPRLELCGALLLAKLITSSDLNLSGLGVTKTQLYTDSQIVLAWLKTPPHTLNVFVANRVTQILELTSLNNWFYVRSDSNPADCASRGLRPQELINHAQWLTGPAFIRSDRQEPLADCKPLLDPDIPERRKVLVHLHSHTIQPYLLQIMNNFSSFTRLVRVFAYVRRFAKRSPSTSDRQFTVLSTDELELALRALIFIVQRHYFAKEFAHKDGCQSSRLHKYVPYIDNHGLIRVGGRLRNASIADSAKHPYILPKQARLSNLLCDHFHIQFFHAGAQLVQSMLQRKYCIIGARSLIRSRIHKCLRCHKLRAQPLQPLMADLPTARVTPSRPFSHAGTDFAGPFSLKLSGRKNSSVVKCYLCIFVCFATKAVHLEIVSSLSTDAFMATFDRFISRRGLPNTMYSDCGTNFKGAARHLREVTTFLQVNHDQLYDFFAMRTITWKFNPPAAPTFGGLWEAAVKSAKFLLKRILTPSAYTFEEYSTIFTRIEAILNSRPLCRSIDDPSVDYLTPGHFLIGAPLLSPPEHPLVDTKCFRSRWDHIKHLHQYFWKRWKSEYLNTLLHRSKWNRSSEPLKIGDIVFLTGGHSNPLEWPMGKISHLHPGTDGVIRVVTIKTSAGSYRRPVSKLVTLPCDN